MKDIKSFCPCEEKSADLKEFTINGIPFKSGLEQISNLEKKYRIDSTMKTQFCCSHILAMETRIFVFEFHFLFSLNWTVK